MTRALRYTVFVLVSLLGISGVATLAEDTGTIDFNAWFAQQPAAQPAHCPDSHLSG